MLTKRCDVVVDNKGDGKLARDPLDTRRMGMKKLLQWKIPETRLTEMQEITFSLSFSFETASQTR
jgi:hypothetical protein